jgi:chromosome partitioning protein
MSLGVDTEDLKFSLRDLLTGEVTDFRYLLWDKTDPEDPSKILKILPANSLLKDIEPELLGSVDGRLRFKARLQSILHQFDYVIIDTAPTTGVMTQSALIAADEVLIPVDVGYFSLQGIRQLLEEINKIKAHFNPELAIAGVLLTKFDSRTKLSKQVESVLRQSFSDQTFQTIIRVNVDLIRAQVERKSIFAIEPESSGAQDYESLVDEILKREQPANVIPLRRAARGKK